MRGSRSCSGDGSSDRGAVVLGLDLVTRGYVPGLAFATEEAKRRRAVLRLVHGCTPLTRAPLLDLVSSHQRRMDEALQGLREVAGRVPHLVSGHVDVEPVVHDGTAAAALLAESQHASLLVVERRRVGAVTHWTSGSTTGAVLASAGCPVAVLPIGLVGARADADVVVGVPEDAQAERVLSVAFEEARLRSASVTAVRAWYDPAVPVPWPFDRRLVQRCDRADEARRRLLDAVVPYASAHPDLTVRILVTAEPASAALLGAAAEASLLVVGQGTHRQQRGPGRVVRECLHAFRCPVVVVGPLVGRPG